MSRRFVALVALPLFIVLALPLIASAQPAAPCPAEPANAIAVTTAYGPRADLANSAVTAAIKAVQKAGFVPVAAAAPSTPPVFTPFGPVQPSGPAVGAACVPTLSLSVSTDMPQALTLYATRYSERVTVTARITLPDGRIWQASQTATAAWYGGYVPVPLPTGGFYVASVPVSTPQGAAEQRAVQDAATKLARQAAILLHTLTPAPPAAAP